MINKRLGGGGGELRIDDPYRDFIEKFDDPKTTDDCYTPPAVYEAVAGWVTEKYGVDRARFRRPFYPGGDYQSEVYGDEDVVVDNPPFSIISQIVKWYVARGVPFFLFAPHLTLFGLYAPGVTLIPTPATITYRNGAKVNTSFVSNLEQDVAIRTAPDLLERIAAAQAPAAPPLPKYEYPDEVVTSAKLGYISKHGVDLTIRREDVRGFVRVLDEQKTHNKSIFGGGLFISEKAAAEKAAAEKAAAEKAAAEKAAAEKAAAEKVNVKMWTLSQRERRIIFGEPDDQIRMV